jgi:hypothetical protein
MCGGGEVRLTPEEREWMAKVGVSETLALRIKVHGHGRFNLPDLVTGNLILDALTDVALRADRWRRALRRARRARDEAIRAARLAREAKAFVRPLVGGGR